MQLLAWERGAIELQVAIRPLLGGGVKEVAIDTITVESYL
jgi:hypothetical protein